LRLPPKTTGWLPVHTNDANAVGGEVATQLQNTPADAQCGADNIFYGENLTTCQGPQPDAHGAPVSAPYNVPWWCRTEFTPEPHGGPERHLRGARRHGSGRPVVNGTQVATREEIEASEPEYTFDVTSLLHAGANALALKVYPNNPGTMLTQDFNV
jgi:exo-1,4-beta-D-glucosaminidase